MQPVVSYRDDGITLEKIGVAACTNSPENSSRSSRELFGFGGNQSDQFERYVAASYLYQYIRDDVEAIEKAVLGGGSDEGIDIAVVTVNGSVVSEPSELEEMISGSNSNVAKVIFIQAKTSEKYDAKLISKFLHGVESVTKYAMKPGCIDLPAALVDIAFLIDKIAENLDQFQHDAIPCEIYYVTTSANDTSSVSSELQVTEALSRIRAQGAYPEDLTLRLHGHQQLASKQRERHGPQNIKFNFAKRETIPDSGLVSEAYIGILPAAELIKLLRDESGEIRAGIFEDNVRLDLGSQNPVNARISDTLASSERTYFPFLNNGLTIVATKMSSISDRFTISGYQVVNGGQTSHQLIRWAGSEEIRSSPELLDDVWVPVKIVSSDDPGVRSSIAVATNLQSPIAASDIQASSEIAKNVEEFFGHSGSDGLRYERQNRGDALDFPRTRVVTTSDLNRAVASALFGESARAISAPKDLESKDSFVWGDYPIESFYYAARILYRVDRHFARKSEDSPLRAAKYHIAMMVSAMINPALADGFKSEGVEASQQKLRQPKNLVFDVDDTRIDNAIPKAIVISRQEFHSALAEGRSLRRDDVRNRRSQENLLREVVTSEADPKRKK